MFKRFTVATPFANLKTEPVRKGDFHKGKDCHLETQMLLGEQILGLESSSGFVFAEAIEQPKFYPSTLEWGGYPGWIERKNLVEGAYYPNVLVNVFGTKFSFGTKFFSPNPLEEELEIHLPTGEVCFIGRNDVIPLTHKKTVTDEGRSRILSWGHKFLGAPYLWGGRSAFFTNTASCDCSGFVSLLYRQEGLRLPRDSHDQFILAKPTSYEELKPADCIFLSSGQRVHHVMLFLEGDLFLEATGGLGQVVIGSGEKKLGRPLFKIKNGEKVGGMRIFYGSFS